MLRRYERTPAGGWAVVGAPIPVVVGSRGLGWAAGQEPDKPIVMKREGDSRTPAGVFRLSGAYGLEAAPPTGTRLPYRQSTESTRCVDDVDSQQYNQILEQTAGADWKSAEVMRRKDGLYDWVVVVGHNEGRVRGDGSCIFLHVWRNPKSPTVGCTAMPKESLAELMAWLDPEGAVLVVLPEPVRRVTPGLP